MRAFLLFLISLFFLGIIAAGLGTAWGWRAVQAPGPLTEHKTVLIGKGAGLAAITRELASEGVVANRLLFLAAARLSGKDKQLQAGEYDFPAGASMLQALDMMAKGQVLLRQVTVPEGLTSWQIVQILNKTDGLTGEITDIPSEGSLLPETYSFTRDEARPELIKRMQAAMQKALDRLWTQRDETSPALSRDEIVILASIVEKETGVAAERKRIAGVFVNRLQKNIPLQSDPTVIYGLTSGKIQTEGMGPLGRRLLSKDLETDSPYNTYRNAGLPPGPIANPGRESLEAALKPERNEFIYFVADGTGGHVFATTLDEHNRNVAQWRKLRSRESGVVSRE